MTLILTKSRAGGVASKFKLIIELRHLDVSDANGILLPASVERDPIGD
jgi:hypothetical protein